MSSDRPTAVLPIERDERATSFCEQSLVKETPMKGMPHLYYATGAARPTRWVGDTLVVAADAEEILRRAQDEDTKTWFEPSWRLPRPRARRLTRSAR